MGSNSKTKRKKIDAPIIKTPESFSSIKEFSRGVPEIVYDACPPSFQEKVEASPYIQEGINVYLLKRGDIFLIMVNGNEVGILSKRASKRVGQCLEMGVHYTGKIVKAKSEYYARFFRETN